MIEGSVTASGYHGMITGEATTWTLGSYIYHRTVYRFENKIPPHMPHISRLVHAVNTHMRLICFLREPVERAISAFIHETHRDYEQVGISITSTAAVFEESFTEALSWWDACIKNNTIDYCVTTPADLAHKYNALSQLRMNLYSEHIRLWWQVFPKEQFLILRYEDHVEDAQTTMSKVHSFLDLPQLQVNTTRKAYQTPTVWFTHFGALSDKFYQRHRLFYKPYNEKLALMMKDEGFLWAHKK